ERVGSEGGLARSVKSPCRQGRGAIFEGDCASGRAGAWWRRRNGRGEGDRLVEHRGIGRRRQRRGGGVFVNRLRERRAGVVAAVEVDVATVKRRDGMSTDGQRRDGAAGGAVGGQGHRRAEIDAVDLEL